MDTSINLMPLNPSTASQKTPSAPEGGGGLPAKAAEKGQDLPASAESPTQRTVAEKQADLASPGQLADQIDDAVQRINEFVQVVQRDLQFSVDDSTGRTVVKVFDSQNEELIRQLPPDEILAVAEYMDEVRGMLIKDKA